MVWYDEACFYHIYPIGMTGCEKKNTYKEVQHRLLTLVPWLDHIKDMNCNALYIGPLCESHTHGYDTTDYLKLDSRLGTNEDLKQFVKECHDRDIKVVFDGVFNHTGRHFFAFQDLRKNRENSKYADWYCNVNFEGDTWYHDHFSYENWGGCDILVKLNQRNPEVQEYIANVIRFWVKEFDIDGIRLDAADVLDFDFMKVLRNTANEVKEDFWLMGEVIHGDYTRWVNDSHLHAVTNYTLHKGLWSGHNEHNYFEIAHTVKRLYEMGGNDPLGLRLYNFADNHDVERIHTKLTDKGHIIPVYILVYTLPGIPSVYYGSEFGIDGKKERWDDYALRPYLEPAMAEVEKDNTIVATLRALGKARRASKALSYGEYEPLLLTNRQYAYARTLPEETVLTVINNDPEETEVDLPSYGIGEWIGVLSGRKYVSEDRHVHIVVPGNGGEVLLPLKGNSEEYVPIDYEPIQKEVKNIQEEKKNEELPVARHDISYEEMSVEELQSAILEKMANNGPVDDAMRKSVTDNIWHDSLVNWVKSFR